MIDDIRTKKYSMKEFNAIPRNSDGDIIDTWEHFPLITEKQHKLLSDDDYSRYENYLEEMRCMMHELELEFGL